MPLEKKSSVWLDIIGIILIAIICFQAFLLFVLLSPSTVEERRKMHLYPLYNNLPTKSEKAK
jgi:hypothetical protein